MHPRARRRRRALVTSAPPGIPRRPRDARRRPGAHSSSWHGRHREQPCLIAAAEAKRRSRSPRATWTHPHSVSAGLRRVCAPFPAHRQARARRPGRAPCGTVCTFSARKQRAFPAASAPGIRTIRTYVHTWFSQPSASGPARPSRAQRARRCREGRIIMPLFSAPRSHHAPLETARSQAISIYYHATRSVPRLRQI